MISVAIILASIYILKPFLYTDNQTLKAHCIEWNLQPSDARPPIRPDWQQSKDSLIRELKHPESISISNFLRHPIESIKHKYQDRQQFYRDNNLPFACMLAGYKNVYIGCTDDLFWIDTKLFAVLIQSDIKCIILPNQNIILYTPQGKRQALLLAKHEIETAQGLLEINDYLVGTLLGYLDCDICAYYDRLEKLFGRLNTFDQDKEQALHWISSNEPTVAAWAITQVHISLLRQFNCIQYRCELYLLAAFALDLLC